MAGKINRDRYFWYDMWCSLKERIFPDAFVPRTEARLASGYGIVPKAIQENIFGDQLNVALFSNYLPGYLVAHPGELTVLDIGANNGNGSFFPFISEFVDFQQVPGMIPIGQPARFSAIDIDAGSLEQLAAAAAAYSADEGSFMNHPGISMGEVLQRKCSDTGLAGSSVDVIISQFTINWLAEDELNDAFREMKRILKPGGYAAVRVPSVYNAYCIGYNSPDQVMHLYSWMRMQDVRSFLQENGADAVYKSLYRSSGKDMLFFTKESLSRRIADAGMEMVDIQYTLNAKFRNGYGSTYPENIDLIIRKPSS